MPPETVILWRPVGPSELELIRQAKMRAFPPRLPDQPIFYPVLSEAYAAKIARDWNVPTAGQGFVTRFHVLKSFLDHYEIQEVGGRDHAEYWIPAEELSAFNKAIVGEIEVIARFPRDEGNAVATHQDGRAFQAAETPEQFRAGIEALADKKR